MQLQIRSLPVNFYELAQCQCTALGANPACIACLGVRCALDSKPCAPAQLTVNGTAALLRHVDEEGTEAAFHKLVEFMAAQVGCMLLSALTLPASASMHGDR